MTNLMTNLMTNINDFYGYINLKFYNVETYLQNFIKSAAM